MLCWKWGLPIVLCTRELHLAIRGTDSLLFMDHVVITNLLICVSRDCRVFSHPNWHFIKRNHQFFLIIDAKWVIYPNCWGTTIAKNFTPEIEIELPWQEHSLPLRMKLESKSTNSLFSRAIWPCNILISAREHKFKALGLPGENLSMASYLITCNGRTNTIPTIRTITPFHPV